MSVLSIAQPTKGTNLTLIEKVVAEGGIERIDIAVAYATRSGAEPLLKVLEGGLGAAWGTIPKRWILAFDYCRTEPLAADRLALAPKSMVRIHDATAALRRKATPRVPFHPKAFIFYGADRQALFAGSGNLSRSGMTRGHEVGLLLDHRGKATKGSQGVLDSILNVREWFDSSWAQAEPYADVRDQYRKLFDSQENLKNPTPTEDDTANFEMKRGGLEPSDLTKLRACRHLWIQAGKITLNRGPTLPGNQLMMKRMSRVFFGIPALDVPKNTALGTFDISLAGVSKPDCSLTYSDNGMDKLTLPVPAGAVATYDDQTLLFTRLSDGSYELTAGKPMGAYKARSTKIGAAFKMSGAKAREWGVF